METIIIRDDFIKLGQVLKLAGLVGSGVDAKIEIQEGFVKVNGEVEVQRGKKMASKIFVFPWALSPYKIFVPLLKSICKES